MYLSFSSSSICYVALFAQGRSQVLPPLLPACLPACSLFPPFPILASCQGLSGISPPAHRCCAHHHHAHCATLLAKEGQTLSSTFVRLQAIKRERLIVSLLLPLPAGAGSLRLIQQCVWVTLPCVYSTDKKKSCEEGITVGRRRRRRRRRRRVRLCKIPALKLARLSMFEIVIRDKELS